MSESAKVVLYLLEHQEPIITWAKWIGGALSAVGGIFVSCQLLLLRFVSKISKDVSAQNAMMAKTHGMVETAVAKVDAVSDANDVIRDDVRNLRAIVSLTEVVEPKLERVKADISEQKKIIDGIISVNTEHATAITNLQTQLETHDRRWHDLERDGVERRHA